MELRSIQEHFKYAGIDRARLHTALRTMGRAWLHRPNVMEWSETNPTRNYCYVVTEWLHRYYAPVGSQVFRVEMPHEDYTHRFNVFAADGPATYTQIIDLTFDQFPKGTIVPYARGRRYTLMQSGGPQPSRRAQLLQHLYQGWHIAAFTFTRDRAVGRWLRDKP